jgi:hypothetical protein
MITNWSYNNITQLRDDVKKMISENNYTSIDVGASANPWSYPECTHFLDIRVMEKENSKFFQIDLQDRKSLDSFVEYVNKEGKFDFSICSHTLEDIFNPIDVMDFLTKISKKGYISIPSKYNEFKFLYDRKYRGNAHHKQFFDVVNDKLVIYPKFSFIEVDGRSDLLLDQDKGDELNVFWEDSIEYEIFGELIPFSSDDELINKYYSNLLS